MVSRFRILSNAIMVKTETAKMVAMSCCILHNILVSKNPLSDLEISSCSKSAHKDNNLKISRRFNNSEKTAIELRLKYVDYFNKEGRLYFQDEIVNRHLRT